MKKQLFTLLGLACALFSWGQLNYAKVKLYATNAQLKTIADLGIAVDHGQHKFNHWIITDLSENELALLNEHGYPYEVLVHDVATYYADHSHDAPAKTDREDCPETTGTVAFDPVTPSNFELGSMGGYLTYEEYLAELDEMRAAYPDLITEKTGIPGYETWEGRPIHWVRISDNADTDEADEPEVLYTAIHHAREPMSLSQTIFYMWYVLENYGTNEEVTYLVDETEMYFVPMINPDGYKQNQTTNPGGGGMHRKNKNPEIGWSNVGVDLNRNYSYHWNESGTSPDENSDVFAGDSAFSEPETRAIKWFCENHEFKFASNAHSYGDLVLYPLGWAEDAFAPDHDYFDLYSNHMTQFNQYTAQKATALYPAAGDSDDWMYIDDLDVKPEIFATTPEVGDAFWPPAAAIEPTCKEMIWPNLVTAHLPHIYGVTTDTEPDRLTASEGYLNYDIQRLGLQDGDLTVSIAAISGFTALGDANAHTLALSETTSDSISYTLNPDLVFGDEIKYVIQTDNGTWTKKDTVIKSYGEGIELFADDCSDLLNWTGEWDITNETYHSAENCITDSPYDGTYGNNVTKAIVLDEILDLTTATYAYATFWAKWAIEDDYDYVQFMASTNDGGTWTPLCGKYTNSGTDDQDAGNPLYDGVQSDWVLEEVDLSDYMGMSNVQLRFLLITDNFVQMDGYYFDDFTISSDASEVDDSGIDELTAQSVRIYPNPANEQIHIGLKNPESFQTITVYNELGAFVREIKPQTVTTFSTNELAEGVYVIRSIGHNGQVIAKRFTVIH